MATILQLLAALACAHPAPEGPPVFERDIQPILNRHCVECHGISKQSNSLRLDTYEHFMAGGKKGVIVEIGKSGDSLIVELLEAEGKKRMPPKGDPLPADAVQLIRKWIDGGARSDPTLRQEALKVAVGELPAGFDPILALAGDKAGKWIAIGRGASIQVAPLPGDAAAPAQPVVLKGHADVVQCLQFSPGGGILASGSFQEVVLWDTASWKEIRRLGPHRDRVLSICFSPDGNLLATGGGEPTLTGEVKVWEVPTGKLFRSLPEAHADAIFCICFNPAGDTLATGSGDKLVHLIDLGTGKRLARFEGHTQHVLSVAFNRDGKRLLSASADGKIKLWNLENNTRINDWNGHGKGVMSILYSPDGKIAASVSGDRSLRLWNGDNGSQIASFGEAKDYLYALAFLGDGKLIASGGRDRTVRIYDTKENKLVRELNP